MIPIPPRPRNPIELNQRYLRTIAAPSKNVVDGLQVIVGVTTHGDNLNLDRCLGSIASQKTDFNFGIVLMVDRIGEEVSLDCIPSSMNESLWILQGNCGSSAGARNTILEFVEKEVTNAEWVARMDGDDRFATPTSLAVAVKAAETTNVNYVIGGNNVLDNKGKIKRVNYASENLKNPQWVLDRLESMANYTAPNEIPSCNLLVAAKSGIRYPNMKSAEDHWLVVDLLINKPEQVTIIPELLFTDYTENGEVSQIERTRGRHQSSRVALANAAKKWVEVNRKKGTILGLGQEGIVRLYSGQVTKYFYPNKIDPKKIEWFSKILSECGPHIPNAIFKKSRTDDTYTANYIWEATSDSNEMDIDEIRKFLLFCLKRNVVCSNIKRTNFRTLGTGELVYIDVGKQIIPMDVSYFRDSAARLYAIGVLGWSDWELLRRPTDSVKPRIWDNLPGFSEFYGSIIEEHLQGVMSTLPSKSEVKVKTERNDVTLLIKACAMDSSYAEEQIIHIVDQLTLATEFKERILVIDSFEGPFIREHNKGNLAELIEIAKKLMYRGVLDSFLIAPKTRSEIKITYTQWFALSCSETHTVGGVPVFSQLWAFDQVQSRYVLQCDIDVLVGKYDSKHDAVGEMINACKEENILSIGFNIAHDPDTEFKPYRAPKGEFVPEVRCGLLDLKRIRRCLPLPNKTRNGKLTTTWYRSLQQHQHEYGLCSLRGGAPSSFYIHPTNERKTDKVFLHKVRDLVSQGLVPASQWDCWDLNGIDSEWKYLPRNEDIVLFARGKDTSTNRLKRFAESLAVQDDQDFGVIVIDDASDTMKPSDLYTKLEWLGERLTLIRNNANRGGMVNHVDAISQYCFRKTSLITVLDLDDALFGRNVISKLKKLRKRGHDVILGAPFRPDSPTAVYHPFFDKPREKWGGDVWIHLRSFTKEIFDKVPIEYYKIEESWIDKCTDYATMVPIVELAKNPIYLPEYMCWHKRTTKMNPESRMEHDWTIKKILAKPRMK